MTVNKSSDMTTGNPIKKILMFALPLFIGTMFQQVYNLVDTMIAGHILLSMRSSYTSQVVLTADTE